VTLDADGRAPNIFFAGLAKCVLTDSTGVVLETKDPVGDDSASKNGFPEWAADVTYVFNQPVTASDGYIYTLLVNNNIGNDPISSPTEWQLFAQTIGFPDTPNGYVFVVDTAEPLKINAVAPNTFSGLVPLSTVTASNVATVDFTGINSTYKQYVIQIMSAVPVTDGATFHMRTSADGGSTFDSGGTDYFYYINTTVNAAQINLTISGVGSDTPEETGYNGSFNIIDPSNTTNRKEILFDYSMRNVFNAYERSLGVGQRASTAIINAVRLYFSSGNIESGTFTLYGVRTS
jgi:hypothetical protein